MRPPTRLAFVSFLWSASALGVAAPLCAAEDAVVAGFVLGPDRTPIPGVLVQLRAGARTLEPGALTSMDGAFRIEHVPAPGHYRVTCALGARVQNGPDVRITSSDALVNVDVGLKLGFFEEVVVTDLREEQSRRDTPATVTTLGREAITRINPTHPGQLMAQVPGVWVNVTGGEGHVTAIRQPLTTNPVYLYLEDGVPTRSTGFFNHNALYEINVPMADGLEVTKGPGSALYGSDAIGGVVNVFTRPALAAPGVGGSLEVGEAAWRRGTFDIAQARGPNGVRAQVNLTHSDGWREATAYDRQSGTLRWDHAGAGKTSVKTVATFSHIDQETAGSSSLTEDLYLTRPEANLTPISYRRVKAFRLSTDLTRVSGPTLLSAIPYFRYDSMGLLPNWALTFDPTFYDTQNTSYGLLAKVRRDLPALRALVVAGVDVDLSPGGRVETAIRPGTEKTPEGKTVYTSYDALATIYDYDATFLAASPYVHAEASPVARLRLSAGLRFDHMQYAYDDTLTTPPLPRYQRPADAHRRYHHLSPKLGLTYRAADPVDVFASYRHAFRAPSEGQLFRQGTARNTIDLRPVRADNVELGLRVRPAPGVSVEVSMYELDKRDDVLSYRNPVDGATEAVNAGHTRHRGVEVGLTARPARWLDVNAGYSRAKHTYEDWVVDPAQGIDYSGLEMETAPREVGNLLVTVSPTARARVSLEVVRLGRYWMDAANTQAYDGHTLLNARASYEVRRGVRLYARLLNAADARYAESASYTIARGREYAPGAPRSAFVGVALGR
jgi:iron complex outermembrane receptor protein